MGGKNSGGGEAKRAREEEQKRQLEIRKGTAKVNNTFNQFDDTFFNKQRDTAIAYAEPQLQDQYQDAGKELTFSLARSGNLDSSTRGEKTGDLQKLFDLNKQKIADDAQSGATQSRNAIEDARSNLVSTLNVTGDATGAANSAISRASALSQPAAYSPLGQLFTDFTSALGTQAAQERAAAASGGAYKSNYNTGLFGNTGKVTVR
jgi:hypothetical protein